ncbi:YCF48-related protein, partial [candidate division KSB1 bacterium]
MKKLLFLIVFTNTVIFTATSQTYGWQDISANLPELGGFNDVHFVGKEGWITGGNDKIYYTSDEGKAGTFSTLNFPASSGISSSVFMKTATDGYAVTFSGNILHGVNNVWTTLYQPGGVFNSVHFPPSSTTGYTCGNNGKIWSFDNSTISDISPSGVVSELQSIIFPVDTSDGKVCGETVIRRYLSGSWNNLQFYDNTYFYNSIYFTDNSNGWAVGTQGTIIHTSDGTSWTIQTGNTTIELNDVFFLTSLEGWAVGSGVLLHTTDGGTTWTQEAQILTSGKNLRAIYF